MGLFSNRCPNCGNALSKDANYCNSCRFSMSKAMRACTSCGSSCGDDSNFCWKCSADLRKQASSQMFGDRWVLTGEDLAARFPIRTPKERPQHGIQVDVGMVGIGYEYSNGPVKLDIYEPGYYALDSRMDRLFKKAGVGDDVRVVLVDQRLFTLDFASELADADQQKFNTAFQLEFRVKDAEHFATMLLREKDLAQKGDLAQKLTVALDDAATQAMQTIRLGDFLSSPASRETPEEKIREKLSREAGQLGLEVLKVRLGRFGGDAWDRLCRQRADLAQAGQDFEYRREMESLNNKERLMTFRSQKELEDELDVISRRYSRSGAERQYADSLWHMRQTHGLEMESLQLQHTKAIEMAKNGAMLRGIARKEEVTETEHELNLDSLRHQSQLDKAAKALELLGKVREGQFRDLAAKNALDLERAEREASLKAKSLRETREALAGTSDFTQISILSANGGVDPALLRAFEILHQKVAPPNVVPYVPWNYGGGMGTNTPTGNPFNPPNMGGFVGGQGGGAAVGFLALKQSGKLSRFVGTVWGWKDFRVVTCAHVIDEAESAMSGATREGQSSELVAVFAGSQGGPSREIRVIDYKRHSQWTGQPISVSGGRPMPAAYDIGWIRLEAQPPGYCPVAQHHAVYSLQQAANVSYYGYPTEDIPGNPLTALHPPLARPGNLALMCGWNLGNVPPQLAQLILHSSPVAGGASGSPLFYNGEVIGVVSAGAMKFVIEGFKDDGNPSVGRFSNPAMVNYAQRIDLLSDFRD